MSDDIENLAKSSLILSNEDEVAYRKIYDALLVIHKDESADRGFYLNGFDMWITVDGKEYFVQVCPSNNQIKKSIN